MSDIIHLLPDSVANQIAAGEVVQRPASVLKELVENSIDAGATSIQIVIKDAGRSLIQIVDNGKGMSATDARMAFERHATSKIKNADDLFAIRTMGFRGEALASIAAIAQVTLRTQREEDELGTQIEIAGSRIFEQEPTQAPVGTSFLVKNLFFNVPARRRFLKSDNVEKTHIFNEFYRIALVNPSIEFSFFDDQTEIFHLPVSNTRLRIENIFGKSSRKRWEQQLLPIESSTDLVNIYGYISKPEFAQKSANQYFFVNGRYMQHPYFRKAVLMAYDKILAQGDNPNYFIYFDIKPENIDINIHPTKTEIKFEHEKVIFPILLATVKEALGKFNILPSIDFDTEGKLDIPVQQDFSSVRPPQKSFNPSYNPFEKKTDYKRPSLDWEQLYQGFENSDEPKEETELIEKPIERSIEKPIENEAEWQQSEINSFETQQSENFQLKNKYILTSVKSGLLFVNQQRAHFRILFDNFMTQIEQSKIHSQQLLFPELLELNENEKLIFEQIRENLKSVGFDFAEEGDKGFLVVGVPAQITDINVLKILHGLIEKAASASADATNEIREIIASFLAETASLKTGQKLSQEEMSDLINRLFASSNPNYSPDGKKILSIVSYDDIENKIF